MEAGLNGDGDSKCEVNFELRPADQRTRTLNLGC